MSKKRFVVIWLAWATAAAALPTGLSGTTFGFGGIWGGWYDDAIVSAEADFRVSPYFGLGPEVYAGFGAADGIGFGAEGRVYFLPNYDIVPQPYLGVGGGFWMTFEDTSTFWEEGGEGGYIHFAGGLDADIPQAPIAPFFELGGFIAIGEETESFFKLETGIRIGAW